MVSEIGGPEKIVLGLGLFLYGLIFFVTFFIIWKFYQILSRINDNIAGIRQALERK